MQLIGVNSPNSKKKKKTLMWRLEKPYKPVRFFNELVQTHAPHEVNVCTDVLYIKTDTHRLAPLQPPKQNTMD